MYPAPAFLETLSLKELGRLITIVASSASIAWAGQLAHSSETPRPEVSAVALRVTERVLSAPTPKKQLRGLPGFAQGEINRMNELHQTLTERAEFLPVGPEPADSKIRKALESLEESLLLSRHALSKLKASSFETRAFNEENMKSQIFRLQEAAREAQGLFLARESAQSFSVSTTGQ